MSYLEIDKIKELESFFKKEKEKQEMENRELLEKTRKEGEKYIIQKAKETEMLNNDLMENLKKQIETEIKELEKQTDEQLKQIDDAIKNNFKETFILIYKEIQSGQS